MKIHFSESEQKIVDILRDKNWHCPTVELHGIIKDDRRRIVDIKAKLNERGFDIESRPCNLHNHSSRLLMRRIVARTHYPNLKPNKPITPKLLDEVRTQMLTDAQTMVREFDVYQTG